MCFTYNGKKKIPLKVPTARVNYAILEVKKVKN